MLISDITIDYIFISLIRLIIIFAIEYVDVCEQAEHM